MQRLTLAIPSYSDYNVITIMWILGEALNLDKQSGKLFLIVSVIFCIFTFYGSVPQFDSVPLKMGYWFLTFGVMLSCLADGLWELKKKRLLYAIGSLLISIALFIFSVNQFL